MAGVAGDPNTLGGGVGVVTASATSAAPTGEQQQQAAAAAKFGNWKDASSLTVALASHRRAAWDARSKLSCAVLLCAGHVCMHEESTCPAPALPGHNPLHSLWKPFPFKLTEATFPCL